MPLGYTLNPRNFESGGFLPDSSERPQDLRAMKFVRTVAVSNFRFLIAKSAVSCGEMTLRQELKMAIAGPIGFRAAL